MVSTGTKMVPYWPNPITGPWPSGHTRGERPGVTFASVSGMSGEPAFHIYTTRGSTRYEHRHRRWQFARGLAPTATACAGLSAAAGTVGGTHLSDADRCAGYLVGVFARRSGDLGGLPVRHDHAAVRRLRPQPVRSTLCDRRIDVRLY